MNGTSPKLPNKAKIKKAECSRCGGIRNCEIRGEHEETYTYEQFQAWTSWYILECRGCEYIFVQKVDTNSEDHEPFYEEDGSVGYELLENRSYWPAVSKRKKPDWLLNFGVSFDEAKGLNEALIEVYGALNSDLNMLAAIGIRTVYDIASEILGVDPNLSFKQKLDSLVKLGGIGALDVDRIETIIDAGSASVHRGWRPNSNDLNTMMDVLEHFIEKLFIAPVREKRLSDDAAKVKKSVPTRQMRIKGAMKPPEQNDMTDDPA